MTLSEVGGDQSSPHKGASAALWSIVAEAIERCDLEAHLALFILHSTLRSASNTALSPVWANDLEFVYASTLPPAPIKRTQDVATLGLRLAIGVAPERATDFASAALREIAREPLPPAACLRDDERVLLGIAAGIGRAAPQLAHLIIQLLREREHTGSMRQACVDLFAEVLIAGRVQYDHATAERAYRLLTAPTVTRPVQRDRDRVALFWTATRLLDSDWRPTDVELSILGRVIDDSARVCWMMLSSEHPVLDPLDAAMIIDALSAAPTTDLVRMSGVDAVLSVIDNFAGSANIVANRHAKRTSFTIVDEYDVQDLFHAVILPIVPDIVPEDPASKIAGKSSRLDFTSKTLRLGVELKYVRSAKHGKEVRDEILIDEATYQLHPYVDTVIAFVYDPGRHIAPQERTTFESDLSVRIAVEGKTVQHRVRVR